MRGYLLLPGALSQATVDDMRRRAGHVLSGAEGGVIRNPMNKDGNSSKADGAVLRCLANLPPKSVAQPLIDTMAQIARRVSRKLGIQTEFAGHADLQANTTKGWHRDFSRGLKIDPWSRTASGATHQVFRVIIYLESHHEDNGALLVLPRTHVDPALTPSGAGDSVSIARVWRATPKVQLARTSPRVVTLRPKLGDALIIDHRVLHRGGDEHGDTGPRHLIQYSFGERGSPFTDDFRTANGAALQLERMRCPRSLSHCVCFDHALDSASCGASHCVRCGAMYAAINDTLFVCPSSRKCRRIRPPFTALQARLHKQHLLKRSAGLQERQRE